LIAIDTSVVVAAFASWHDRHGEARRVAAGDVYLPAQVFLEAYAVLTRLPAPHRIPAWIAAEFLRRRFPHEVLLHPDPDVVARLPTICAEAGLSGGATYDALIGLTCLGVGAELYTLDRRSLRNHRALGVDIRLVA